MQAKLKYIERLTHDVRRTKSVKADNLKTDNIMLHFQLEYGDKPCYLGCHYTVIIKRICEMKLLNGRGT